MNNFHHGYIIEGPYNSKKLDYALGMIMDLMCENKSDNGACKKCSQCVKLKSLNHIDLIYVKAEKSSAKSSSASVKSKQIENLIESINGTPLEGEYRIALIEDADTMSVEAANKLLKTLEEPPKGAIIFLLSENVYNLPITIRSRALTIRIEGDEKKVDDEVYEGAFMCLYKLLNKKEYSSYELFKDLEYYSKDRLIAISFIDSIQRILRDYLLLGSVKYNNFQLDENYFSSNSIFDAVRGCEIARRDIKDNMRIVFALKKLFLNMER